MDSCVLGMLFVLFPDNMVQITAFVLFPQQCDEGHGTDEKRVFISVITVIQARLLLWRVDALSTHLLRAS